MNLIPPLTFGLAFDTQLWSFAVWIVSCGQKNVFANSLAGWMDTGFLPNVARSNTTTDN